ncbi:UNVERIFIED_CONTAM: hypothetical protein PYX00_008347 [Menopon gallinae]|uniref:Uncharacterized protein n=1 Tax=Menopon gallinae TaxID=328185 RepID=A0AAW2HMG5_9NEOP
MELEKNPSKYGENYVEAETISNDDSEKSSLLEFHDLNLEENHCTEGVLKLKNLIEDLEASFRVSNAIDNSLLLKCILLEAENDNLKRIAREKNVKVNLCRSPVSLSSKSDYNKTNRLWKNKEGTNVQREIHGERGKAANSNLSKMQETIHKLEGELKDREKTVALLCEKYLYLKSNKNRMEIDF